ncbi:MAG: hypothetical protein KAG96_00460 [Ichthyobacteriaceae bacterium]|nr:hypothetical protein [Ichthyobacteriaceae bacterium]
MNYKQLFIGMILGFVTPIFAFSVWVTTFTDFDVPSAIDFVIKRRLYAEVLSLSAISNMVVFYLFIETNKDTMAKGVIFTTMILAFIVFVIKMVK